MNDTPTACATYPHRARPQPLTLLPEQRVDLLAKARAGRVAALAAKAERKAQAFQPVEAILINPDFRARVAAIAVRHARPLAAG